MFSNHDSKRNKVEALMHASECRRNAEDCLKLAQELDPKHRGFLIDQADEWLKVARLLSDEEGLRGRVDGFSTRIVAPTEKA
jgi:hypothetical protein